MTQILLYFSKNIKTRVFVLCDILYTSSSTYQKHEITLHVSFWCVFLSLRGAAALVSRQIRSAKACDSASRDFSLTVSVRQTAQTLRLRARGGRQVWSHHHGAAGRTFKVYLARVHSSGRGQKRESLQISAEGKSRTAWFWGECELVCVEKQETLPLLKPYLLAKYTFLQSTHLFVVFNYTDSSEQRDLCTFR